MAQVQVTIDGKTFRMGCEDGQEDRIRQLAADLDGRIGGLRGHFGEIGDLRLCVMAALQVTDELHEERQKMRALEARMEAEDDARSSGRDEAEQREAEIAEVIEALALRVERIASALSGQSA